MQALKDTMDKLRNEEGLVGIVDIVLNHVAHNSPWIADHPEACFSTENVPRLWPAWLLDEAFMKMSEEYALGRISSCKSAPYLKTE